MEFSLVVLTISIRIGSLVDLSLLAAVDGRGLAEIQVLLMK